MVFVHVFLNKPLQFFFVVWTEDNSSCSIGSVFMPTELARWSKELILAGLSDAYIIFLIESKYFGSEITY